MKNIIKKPKNVLKTRTKEPTNNVANLQNFKSKNFVILLSKKNVNDYLKQKLKTPTGDNGLSLKTILCSPPIFNYSKRLSMRSKPTTSNTLKSNKQDNLLQETIEIVSKTDSRNQSIKEKTNEAGSKENSSSGIELSKETNLLHEKHISTRHNEKITESSEIENKKPKSKLQSINIKEILGNRACYIPLKRVNLNNNITKIESEIINSKPKKKKGRPFKVNAKKPSSETNIAEIIPQSNDETQLSQRISKRRQNLFLKVDSNGNDSQRNEKLKESTNIVLETEKENKQLNSLSNNNNEIFAESNPVCSSLNSSLILKSTPPEKTVNFLEHKSREQNPNSTAKRILFFTAKHALKNTQDICTNTQKPITTPKNCDNKNKICSENVYDFLPQPSSPTNDPAADIIEKLISEGRAKVIKYRPKVKRLQAQSAKIKKKQKKATKLNKEEILKATGYNIGTPKNRNEQNSSKTHFDNDNTVLSNKNGRFSYLAQSIMKKQAKRMNPPPNAQMVTARKKLLEVANKFLSHSTPINIDKRQKQKYVPEYSPVLENKSPWRCENVSLPNIFNFTLNSQNLPSHSSDVIECSQNNNITTNTSQLNDTITIVENVSTPLLNVSQLNDSNIENNQTPVPRTTINTTTNTSQSNDAIVENVQIPLLNVSQLNDSNMENIRPPKSRTTINQNEMYRLSLNPKRSLSLRSPLKPINIINMVHLPTLTQSEVNKIQRKEISLNDTTESFEQSDIQISEKGPQCPSPAKTNDILKKSDEKDPFGFNEIITEEDDRSSGQQINYLSNLNASKKHLESFLPKIKPTRCSYEAIKPIFKVSDGYKSRNIKEMLTSTRIEHHNGNNVDNSVASDNLSVTQSLFSDYDPETTFDTKNSRRTYSRIIQKKRKLRNNFVLFLDSDESGSELDETKDEARTTHRTRKKKKLGKEENPQLNQFIEQFNSLCDEVEQFPLVIE